MQPHPFLVLPAMLLYELTSSFSSTARNVVVVQLVCEDFRNGTSCDSETVTSAAAAFNLRFSLAEYLRYRYLACNVDVRCGHV